MPKEILDKIADKVKKYNDPLLNKWIDGLINEYNNLIRYIQQRNYRFIAFALLETGEYACDIVTRLVDMTGTVEGEPSEVIKLLVQYKSALANYIDKELSK
jgi:hypothetical protein